MPADAAGALLDTHAVLWLVAGGERLSAPARGCIDDQASPLLVSAVSLPWHHRDPFDRLLVAQALAERLAIVSSDPVLAQYGVEVVW